MNLSKVQGTGPNNRIIKADVLEFKQEQKVVQPEQRVEVQQQVVSTTSTPLGAEYEDIELSNIRKVIAERLLYSKQNIPHYYLNVECNVDRLSQLRNDLNKHSSVKITFNDILIKAASLANMKVPEANSSWQGNSIRKYKNVDMCVAVQTDFGLITPIVTSANLKGLEQISKEVKELAGKAKQNKLKPHEFQGGTFTISNLGMLGITSFSAIINPPQVIILYIILKSCILAVGKTEKKVVCDENTKNKDQPFK